jgi:hypothetical protein
MMRAKGAIGIEKNPLNAFCKELIDGDILKPFYLHKGLQPGRAKGQGNQPGSFGPGEAFALRRGSGTHLVAVIFQETIVNSGASQQKLLLLSSVTLVTQEPILRREHRSGPNLPVRPFLAWTFSGFLDNFHQRPGAIPFQKDGPSHIYSRSGLRY